MKAGKKIPPKKILLNSILCMESQQKWQNNNAFERKERMNETNIFPNQIQFVSYIILFIL